MNRAGRQVTAHQTGCPQTRVRFGQMCSAHRAFQGALVVKNPSANARDARDTGLISVSGRSPGGGHGNPLQYSCLENPMDRGAWWATVHGVAESWTRLKRLHM